jgi:two-component system phosphate regulon response regulator PhoB
MAENLALIQIHGIVIDPAKWEVFVEGKPLSLTSNQFRLLYFLASNAGKVFTRQRIIEAVHGPDYAVTEKSVDVQMVELRRRLGNLGTLIQTERGIGFRFQA